MTRLARTFGKAPQWLRSFRQMHRFKLSIKALSTSPGALAPENAPLREDDWNHTEEFFNFTRGRFLNDGPAQLAKRRRHFDLRQLARIAAESIGAARCVSVRKFQDGMYNRAFVMSMDDGRQVVAKVPNPNAGIAHYTTASEVATMDFMRNVLNTPAPTVHAWSSKSGLNTVGAEYIIMEKVPGVPISIAWDKMKMKQKASVISTLANYQKRWLKTTFSHYGSLFYETDINDSLPNSFYTQDGAVATNGRFRVGPACGRDWIDAGRATLECDRGPWPDIDGYLEALAKRESIAVQSLAAPNQMALFCGPSLYRPNSSKKLIALKHFRQIYRYLIPTNPAITASHLWHNDLHDENIFVDAQDPGKITGIIDWQSAQVLPLFLQHPEPSFIALNYDEPESLDRPPYPDRAGLSDERWKAVMQDYTALTVFLGWRSLVKSRIQTLDESIEWRKTAAFALVFLAMRMFEYGESHFRSILVDLKSEWSQLPMVQIDPQRPSFPFDFTTDELREIEEDADGAVNGTELVAQLKEEMGNLWPDKGLIEPERYEEAKAALRGAKARVKEDVAKTDEERADFERHWPFDD